MQQEEKMEALYAIGVVVVVIILVVGLLIATKRETPTGCLIFLGAIFLLMFVMLVIVPMVAVAR